MACLKLWTSTAAIIVPIVLNLAVRIGAHAGADLRRLRRHAVLLIVYALTPTWGTARGGPRNGDGDSSRGVEPRLFATLVIPRAFSPGGGTFTGIEAVSNGLQILRAQGRDGQADDRYMSTLAFTAAGLLISFLLIGVRHSRPDAQRHLFYSMTENWMLGGFHLGHFR